MSAFVCSQEHINSLLAFTYKNFDNYFSRVCADELGQTLQDANWAGVTERYGYRAQGHFGDPYPPFIYDSDKARPLTLVEYIKNVQCFEYQCDQGEDFRGTDAGKVLASMLGCAIGALPGYKEAPWGIE